MGKENIEKYSNLYALLKRLGGLWHNNVFYRKVIVLGRDHINPDDHLIFAPNHQNAMMDALAVLFTQKSQLVFLGRADIFKRKFIASLLYFIKIMPVYRIRDGFSALKENDEVFDKTIDVLRSRSGLVILPEGDHAGFRRLRQLKKGICRVAFQADEASGFTLGIKIIPVGIEYTNYHRYRQVLTVVYGRPIDTAEYHDLYKKSPEIALNELRTRISTEIKKLIVHIDSDEDYEAIDELRSIINGKYSDDIRFPKLFRDRVLIDKLNSLKGKDIDIYKRIISLSLDVKEKAREMNIDYHLLRKKKHSPFWLIAGIAWLLLTLPIFIYGNIFNFTFLGIPNLQIRKVKDTLFHSSIRYGMSLVLALILSPIFLALAFIIFSPWWLSILIFTTLPLSGLFAWNYYLFFRRIVGGFRIRKYITNKNNDYKALNKKYAGLLDLIKLL